MKRSAKELDRGVIGGSPTFWQKKAAHVAASGPSVKTSVPGKKMSERVFFQIGRLAARRGEPSEAEKVVRRRFTRIILKQKRNRDWRS